MNTRIDTIGALIRSERTRRGMTLEALGKKDGVGKAQISKIERTYDPDSHEGIGRTWPVGVGTLAGYGSRRSACNRLHCGQHRRICMHAWHDGA